MKVCDHEWRATNDNDRWTYCQRCFIPKEHLVAVTALVLDTILFLTVGLHEKVDRNRLLGSFLPPDEDMRVGEGWGISQYYQDALTWGCIGRKKIELGLAELLAAGIVYYRTDVGSTQKRYYFVAAPDQIRAQRIRVCFRAAGVRTRSARGEAL